MATVCRAMMEVEVSDLPSCERDSVDGNAIVEAIGSVQCQSVKQGGVRVLLQEKMGL